MNFQNQSIFKNSANTKTQENKDVISIAHLPLCHIVEGNYEAISCCYMLEGQQMKKKDQIFVEKKSSQNVNQNEKQHCQNDLIWKQIFKLQYLQKYNYLTKKEKARLSLLKGQKNTSVVIKPNISKKFCNYNEKETFFSHKKQYKESYISILGKKNLEVNVIPVLGSSQKVKTVHSDLKDRNLNRLLVYPAMQRKSYR